MRGTRRSLSAAFWRGFQSVFCLSPPRRQPLPSTQEMQAEANRNIAEAWRRTGEHLHWAMGSGQRAKLRGNTNKETGRL